MARITTIHANDVTTGCWSGHESGLGTAGLTLPNSSRAACVAADTGFHSAITLSGPGKLCSLTNVLAMNVNGNTAMKLALLNTSGLRTHRPIAAIIHENA